MIIDMKQKTYEVEFTYSGVSSITVKAINKKEARRKAKEELKYEEYDEITDIEETK